MILLLLRVATFESLPKRCRIDFIALMLFGKAWTRHPFRTRSGGREAIKRDCAAPTSSRVWGVATNGGGMFSLGQSDMLYITFPTAVQCPLKIFRRAIPERYRSAVSQLPQCSPATTANRYDARTNSYEERETQVYDCSLLGHRPASH
jgi:hypothetical protein